MAALTSGYPRFVTHFYIRRIAEAWVKRFGLEGREVFVTASETVAREALEKIASREAALVNDDGLIGIHLPADSPEVSVVKSLMQHVGGGISSRRAEDYLFRHGDLPELQSEERADPAEAKGEVREKIGQLFGAPADRVLLGSSGMNAFYAVFRSLEAIQSKRGRREWIQLGWLYVDTIEILRKLSGGRHTFLNDVLDLDILENLLQERGDQVAGIVTEIPTNPLIQTTDLPRLRDLAKRHDIPLIADPTLASPFNIDVLPLCDVAINSLTKYAACRGDVMMGAAVFNPDSPWAAEIQGQANRWLTPPFLGDLSRIAFEMRDYASVMEQINRNTVLLTEFLQNHPAVEKVFGAYTGASGKNYTALQRRPDSPGGMISIKLRKPVAEFYDRVQTAKGPSFGTVFTILCPFLYLAHYNLVSSEEGRRSLARCGIDPELVRISLGTENSEEIIAAFNEAL